MQLWAAFRRGVAAQQLCTQPLCGVHVALAAVQAATHPFDVAAGRQCAALVEYCEVAVASVLLCAGRISAIH